MDAVRYQSFAEADRAAVGDLSLLPLPTDPLANVDKLVDVWVDPTKTESQICIDYANGESQGAPGWITLVTDGRTVDVVGHLSDEELIRIAASILGAGTLSGHL